MLSASTCVKASENENRLLSGRPVSVRVSLTCSRSRIVWMRACRANTKGGMEVMLKSERIVSPSLVDDDDDAAVSQQPRGHTMRRIRRLKETI